MDIATDQRQVRAQLFNDIIQEMARQDNKWGQQDHDPHKWNTIIMEELGEVAKDTFENNEEGYYKELIQVAACCIQAALTSMRIGFKP